MNEYRPLGNSLFPPVVKNLMIINGIMFLATSIFEETFGLNLTDYFGLFYFESDKFRVWQLFTHLFMHGSFSHIFSNMLSLWMFGSVLENLLGSKRFLSYYFLTGFGAGVLHSTIQYLELHSIYELAIQYKSNPNVVDFQYFASKYAPNQALNEITTFISAWKVHPNTMYVQQSVEIVNSIANARIDTVTVGASGAVFALLFAFGYLFPNMLIYVYFAIPIKAKYFVAMYGAFELFSGIRNADNIAHYAHLGGMLFGFILLKYWKIRRPHYWT